MCLDKITHRFSETESKQVVNGYKIFRINDTTYKGMFIETLIETNQWQTANVRTITTSKGMEILYQNWSLRFSPNKIPKLAQYQYSSGFHCLLDKKSCERFYREQYAVSHLFRNDEIVLQCKFTDLICKGIDCGEEVIVARKMWVFAPQTVEVEEKVQVEVVHDNSGYIHIGTCCSGHYNSTTVGA